MPEALLDQHTLRRLEQLTLVSRKLAAGRLKGERRGRRRGSSTDFADYRDYAPGDDLRFLDWKIYGRLERLFIKLFVEEEDLRVNILLDTSRSMAWGDPQKLLYAKRVAAALGYVCLARMDSLTLRAFSDAAGAGFGPKRGKGNAPACFDFLARLEPGGTTRLRPSLRTFAHAAPPRSMTVVLSDFYDFEGYEDALRPLFARNMDVLLVHVLSPEELRPSLAGDLRLVDVELGHGADVSMGPAALAAYRRALNAFCDGLRAFAAARGAGYLLTSTELPFDKLVLDVLRRRGVLR